MVLTIASWDQDDGWCVDFACTFMHAEAEDGYYVEPPYDSGEDPNYVWQCDKAFNGLRKAPAWWTGSIARFLQSDLGFYRCETDPQIFVNHQTGDRMVLHVDDPFATGKSEKLQDFWQELAKHVEVKKWCLLSEVSEEKCLAKRIAKTERGFVLSNYDSYFKDTLK